MSKELRIGIISVITIAVMIWGFQYLKGKNLLSKVYSFEVVLADVEGLEVASPVQINGYGIGAISSIGINPQDVKTMIVKFDVEGEYYLPKGTKALNSFNGLVGGKKLMLLYDKACSGDNCLQGGERLEGGNRGMIQAMVNQDDVSQLLSGIRKDIGPVLDTVMKKMVGPDSDNAISNSLNSLEQATKSLASLTINMDRLLRKSFDNLDATIENMAIITQSFADTNDDLEKTIRNFGTLSDQLVKADIGGTLSKTSETFDHTNDLLKDLRITVEKANSSFDNVNSLLSTLENGEGTISKLLSDPEIYYNLRSTTEHLSLLLQDLRLNPKRYVNVSVFGKKDKAYVAPEADPAFQSQEIPKENKN